jgi:ABC-type lipoprotein export system ATPase subunit
MVAIMGLSGSGKSTLLGLLGGLLSPDRWDGAEGASSLAVEIHFDGSMPLRAPGRRDATRHIGFVFQEAHLLGSATGLSNIPLNAANASKSCGELARFSHTTE